jgi:hypothetical protein
VVNGPELEAITELKVQEIVLLGMTLATEVMVQQVLAVVKVENV